MNAPAVIEAKSLEGSMKALWERTKRAGELIAQLREERTGLQRKTTELERELGQLREDLGHKEELIKKLTAEQAKLGSKDDVVFSDGERQQLGARVKELLAKIESYL